MKMCVQVTDDQVKESFDKMERKRKRREGVRVLRGTGKYNRVCSGQERG